MPGSTPVIAFGDPSRAEVASLGINPSKRESVEAGALLSGDQRRLATLESLGADHLTSLSEEQVREVVGDCARYFQRNPYRRWFDPLDRLLRHGLETSYYDDSACHLDLVYWATDPVWRQISDHSARELLDDGVPHLREQLRREIYAGKGEAARFLGSSANLQNSFGVGHEFIETLGRWP